MMKSSVRGFECEERGTLAVGKGSFVRGQGGVECEEKGGPRGYAGQPFAVCMLRLHATVPAWCVNIHTACVRACSSDTAYTPHVRAAACASLHKKQGQRLL
eukprot:134499-Chlamydomonas_euryale.AAC.2